MKAHQERVIHIKAFVENKTPKITLENNAGNIDESIIDKIFDPYVTTKESSSGLGLYMSKMIVEKNSATLHVKNTEHGVIFTIKF